MSATDYPDAVHNFILSQKLTTLLGNFPEVSVAEFSDCIQPLHQSVHAADTGKNIGLLP